ncbi:MAG TPA: AMP-binding protein [Pirellula sp.]|nr:AMP-binding protein [Pirellula sp.]
MSHLSIIERAKSYGSAIAIRQGERELKFDELLKSSECVASALIGSNADLEQNRVAMLCSTGLEFAICQWGIWRAGGVCVPLSSSATASELEYAIADCRPLKVLAQQKHFGMLKEICGRLDVPLFLFEDVLLVKPTLLPIVNASRRAMILYTSGTTNKQWLRQLSFEKMNGSNLNRCVAGVKNACLHTKSPSC